MTNERVMAGLKLAVGADEDEAYTFEEALASIAKEAGYQVVPRGAYVPEQPGERIYPALIEAMREVGAVAKLGEYREREGAAVQYRFRGVDAVVNACGPALRKAGVIPVPHVEHVERTPGTTKNGGSKVTTVVKVRYQFTAADGSHVDVDVEGEATDMSDKGTGKAMSVAYRIALLQLFAIPTDDPDPDAVRIEGGHTPPLSDALAAYLLSGIRTEPVERLEGLWHLLTAHVQPDASLPNDADNRVWWEVFAERYRAEVEGAAGKPGLAELWKTLGQFGRTFRLGREGDVGTLITQRGEAMKAAFAEVHDMIRNAQDTAALDLAVEVLRQHVGAHRIVGTEANDLLSAITVRRDQLDQQWLADNAESEVAAALAEEAANDQGDGEGVDY